MERRRFCLALAAGIAFAPARAAELVGGPCDGCELIHVGRPKSPGASLRLAPEGEPGEPLVLEGLILHADGRTPAAGVVLYLHQTDARGQYAGGKGRARRHGRLRGWLQTGADGAYSIHTIRPVAYPGRDIPAHIHATVLEPGRNEYYLDDYVFSDDPLLASDYATRAKNRGGSGVLRLERRDGTWHGRRDIVLGRNIPGYR